MLSSLLMRCYEKKGLGSAILAPITQTLIAFLGGLYVDDTDLIITQPHYLSSEDVRADLQHAVNEWGKLLISTGGALNPQKCYWYMVDYTCTKGE